MLVTSSNRLSMFDLSNLSSDTSSNQMSLCSHITKLPKSGDVRGNITDFGKVIHCHLKQSDIAIQISRRRLFCFYILLFNDILCHFQLTYMRYNSANTSIRYVLATLKIQYVTLCTGLPHISNKEIQGYFKGN